jgi:hypothetical protein
MTYKGAIGFQFYILSWNLSGVYEEKSKSLRRLIPSFLQTSQYKKSLAIIQNVTHFSIKFYVDAVENDRNTKPSGNHILGR